MDNKIITQDLIVPTSLALSPIQLEEMLESTDDCRVIVASLNRKTGEYRLIVQGTLVKDNFMTADMENND